MREFNKSSLLRALRRLGELAQAEGILLEICMYGGALMALVYDNRRMTKDVDAVVYPSKKGWALAKKVAQEQGLPSDWLNDDVKTFLAPFEQFRELPIEVPGLQLTAPTASYLLAMKALACRAGLPGYASDLDDLRFLIKKMEITSVEAIQAVIDRYYPDDGLPNDHKLILETLIDEVWNV